MRRSAGSAKHFSFYCFSLLFLILLFPFQLLGEVKPVRIGATVSLEGKFQKLSFMVRQGYELWAKEVNTRGGLLGRPVELVFHDDKSNPELAGVLYEKLINDDKVDMILSPYGSTLTMTASAVTEKHGYVMMASSASAVQLWRRGFKYVFGVYATADRYFIGFLDLMAREGLTSVGVIYEDSLFNIAAANGVRRWSEMFGLEISYYQSFHDEKKELPKLIEQIQLSGIDGLVFAGYPPQGYHFLDLLIKSEYRPRTMAVAIIPAFADFYDKVGEFANGIFGPSQWEADERLPFPDTERFIRKFKKKTGKVPTYHACAAYSAGQILEQAVVQAQAIDHEQIRAYVSSLDTITIMGRFKVDHKGSQIGHNPILIQWQNGKKEIVYPRKMKTAAPQTSKKKR